MVVRELLAKLGIELDNKSFSAADVLVEGLKVGLVALGGFAIAAGTGLAALVGDLVETTGELNDTSQAIGVTAEALQTLTYAARLNGASQEDVATSLGKLNKHLYAAKQGNEEAVKTFAALHIKVRDASGGLKSADVIFGEVADRFAKMPDGPKKTALAMDLFGKSGAKLIPTLNSGAKGLADLADEAREAGFVIDKETIAAGDDLGDNLDRLKMAAQGLGYSIGGPLLAPINDLVISFRGWLRANRDLITQRVDTVIKGLSIVGKALVKVLNTLYKTIGFVIDNWRLFAVVLTSTVLAAIIANAGAITMLIGQYVWLGAAAVTAAARAAIAWLAAAAAPIAIAALIAIAILLADELITYLEGGDTLIGELAPKWAEFLENFINGGSDSDPWWLTALRGLAALVMHFPQIWDQMITEIKAAWQAFGAWINEMITSMVNSITGRITGAFNSVKSFLHIGTSGPGAVIGGGAASPAASAAAARSAGGVYSSNTTNDFKIYQQPGQDATDVAGKVRAQIDAARQTELDQAAAALGM